MVSVHIHPAVLTEYLEKELRLGRMLGPFEIHHFPHHMHVKLVVNRFGVIPNGHNTRKRRLITDLSFPEDDSVNDGSEDATTRAFGFINHVFPRSNNLYYLLVQFLQIHHAARGF